MPPGPLLPNPEEQEPFWAGRSEIDVAAIAPVSLKVEFLAGGMSAPGAGTIMKGRCEPTE